MSEIRVLAYCVSGEGLLDLQTAVFLHPHMVEGGGEREREAERQRGRGEILSLLIRMLISSWGLHPHDLI